MKKVEPIKWTHVENGLPDANVECLVRWGKSFGKSLIGIARCVPDNKETLLWRGHGGSHKEVTHWFPIPADDAEFYAQEEVALPLPKEDSQEANDAIHKELVEYNFPANPQNAGRAGWRAARLYVSSALLD